VPPLTRTTLLLRSGTAASLAHTSSG
jgi:hypothetical protein